MEETSHVVILFVSHQRFIVYVNKGDHGFHNGEMDMKTIFRAFGPDFKKNFLSEPFDSIHVYPLMCKLLQIEPAPHNGSLTVTENLLLHSGESDSHHFLFIYLCIYYVSPVSELFHQRDISILSILE